MRKFIWVLICSLCITCSGVVPVAYAAGSLQGWGFAKDDDITEEQYVRELDTTVKHSGAASLKMCYYIPYVDGGSDNIYSAYTINGLKKGTTYQYGLAVKAKNASACSMHLSWMNTVSLTPLGATFDWQEFSYRYTWELDTKSAMFAVDISDYTEAIWIDDVYFCEVLPDGTLGPNMVANGGFETLDQQAENVESVGKYTELYNKIKESDSFTNSDIKKVLGAFKFAPVYKADGINVDGNLDEWEGYPTIALPTKADQYHIYINNVALDNQATCQYAYDDKNFYLAIEVEDLAFVADHTAAMYWMGDSIQIAMCDTDQTYDDEIGFVHNPETGKGEVYSASLSEEKMAQINLKTNRIGTKTIYEAAIPWSVRYDDGKLPEGFLFDIIVNDNDGLGRVYCLELAPGIAEGKNSAEFPYLKFLGDKGSWYSWLESDKEITALEQRSFDVYIVNEGNTAEYTISVPDLNINEKVTVSGNSGIRKSIGYSFEESGNKNVKVQISNGSDEQASEFSVYVKPASASFDTMFDNLDLEIKKMDELFKACDDKGITTEYEKVNYSIVKLFVDYLKEDIQQEAFDRAQYVYNAMMELSKEACSAMEDYLNGTKTPKPVTRQTGEDFTVNGTMCYTTTDTNGVIEENRPYFYTGFNQLGERKDSEFFRDLGVDFMQRSHAPGWGTVQLSYNGSEYFTEGFVSQDLIDELWACTKKGLNVDLLIEPNIVGNAAMQHYQKMVGKGVANTNVPTPLITDEPVFRDLVKKHINVLIGAVKDIPSVKTICLMNEPSNESRTDYYKGYFAQYLTEQYHGDIAELNKAYGTSYKNFLEVPFPDGNSATRQFYDYKTFNDNIYTDFVKYMTECVKAVAPDLPVHVKIMPMSGAQDKPSWRWFLEFGTDHDKISQYTDLNGNDAQGYLRNPEPHQNLMLKLEFYDIQTGDKDVPCFNSEDHIIQDKSSNFTAEQAQHVEADIWQSAIHGKALSTAWGWGRPKDTNSSVWQSFSYRPDCIAKIGHTAYDLNRLARELEPVVKAKENVAVLQSLPSRVYNLEYMNAAYLIWKNSLFLGQRVEFLPEGQIERAKDYPLLFITHANNVFADTLTGIKDYIDNGGKVFIMGEDSLKYDQHQNPHDETLVKYIKDRSVFIPTTYDGAQITSPTESEVFDKLRAILKDNGFLRVEVTDTETGLPAKEVEYNYAEYNGNMIINLLNYTYDKTKNLKITVDGKQVDSAKELRTLTGVGSDIAIEPYVPILLKVGDAEGISVKMTINNPKMTVNGVEKPIDDENADTAPKVINDRTMIPVRSMAESIGASVEWNDETKTAVINYRNTKIELTVGSKLAKVNGTEKELETEPLVINDRTMFPARFIVETLGGSVSWNNALRQVSIWFEKQ